MCKKSIRLGLIVGVVEGGMHEKKGAMDRWRVSQWFITKEKAGGMTRA